MAFNFGTSEHFHCWKYAAPNGFAREFDDENQAYLRDRVVEYLREYKNDIEQRWFTDPVSVSYMLLFEFIE